MVILSRIVLLPEWFQRLKTPLAQNRFCFLRRTLGEQLNQRSQGSLQSLFLELGKFRKLLGHPCGVPLWKHTGTQCPAFFPRDFHPDRVHLLPNDVLQHVAPRDLTLLPVRVDLVPGSLEHQLPVHPLDWYFSLESQNLGG